MMKAKTTKKRFENGEVHDTFLYHILFATLNNVLALNQYHNFLKTINQSIVLSPFYPIPTGDIE